MVGSARASASRSASLSSGAPSRQSQGRCRRANRCRAFLTDAISASSSGRSASADTACTLARSGLCLEGMAAQWSEIVSALHQGGAGVGLDIVHPFSVAAYNDEVAEEWRIEAFGRAGAL